MNEEAMKGNAADTVVIIPAYEPPGTFPAYVDGLLATRCCRVLVVDDGSGEAFTPIFSALEKKENCTVLRYPENHGKGYALKHAFAYCKEHDGEGSVYVTADCDGQHMIEDALACIEEARRHPRMLVLGVRNFSNKTVPFHNKFGNIFTRSLFRFLYGIAISDTQTGLRAFSYCLLERLLAIPGNRFEYEMNMLIRLHKAKIGVHEVPISTIYLDKPADGGRVSHFHVFKDSVRVLGTLAGNLGWYVISSLLSAVTDVVAFYLLLRLLGGMIPSTRTLVAVVGARVLSSLINFTFNFKFVFEGKSKRAIVRYYMLWTCQLSLSYLFTYLLGLWVHHELLLTLCKGVFDLCLGICSYQIQRVWVFRNPPRKNNRFYGAYFRTVRFFYRLFTKRYRAFVQEPAEPTVYLCRHLDLHGAFVCYSALEFDVHGYVLHPFFTFRSCYRQYADYTFTARHGRRGLRAFFGRIRAFLAALGVAPLVRSCKAIAVYRGSAAATTTFRESLRIMERGESILLFPDIDYTAREDAASDIYSGFLYLDKLWYRRTRKHICFTVLSVDDARRELSVAGTVCLRGGAEDFAKEAAMAKEKITALLMHTAD